MSGSTAEWIAVVGADLRSSTRTVSDGDFCGVSAALIWAFLAGTLVSQISFLADCELGCDALWRVHLVDFM